MLSQLIARTNQPSISEAGAWIPFWKSILQKNYPIDPIYFGHLSVEREKFWLQIIAPTKFTFHIARMQCQVQISILNWLLSRCSRIKTQPVSLSVKSIHLPHSRPRVTINWPTEVWDQKEQWVCIWVRLLIMTMIYSISVQFKINFNFFH